MKFANLVSVLGLIVSSHFSYNHFFLGSASPGYHPSLVNLVILVSFAISYAFSLTGAKTTAARIMGMLFSFLGFSVTILFSILVLLERTVYPVYWGVPGAYIQFLFFLLLVYFWVKHR